MLNFLVYSSGWAELMVSLTFSFSTSGSCKSTLYMQYSQNLGSYDDCFKCAHMLFPSRQYYRCWIFINCRGSIPFFAPYFKLLWYSLCVLLIFSEVIIGKLLMVLMPDVATFERGSLIHFCYINDNIIFGLICKE